jgi:amino acid transporter
VNSGLRRVLGPRDVFLFNLAAVIGIRWLAAAAQAGSGSVLLWLLAAAFFFVPSALAVSLLAARYPEQGGIYIWTRETYGAWHGFLCGWCYWLSNLFYFPNLLISGLAMAAAAFGFTESKAVIVTLSLVLLWIALAANLLGFGIGKWTHNIAAVAVWAAGALIVAAGAAAWIAGGPATPMRLAPDWSLEKLNFWSQIAFAFGGLELGAILAGEIRDPARTVPRMAWASGAAIAVFYILGTLGMLALLPAAEISAVTGLVQAGQAAGARFGFPALAAVMILLVITAVTGQVTAWIGGAARLPFVIGLDRNLPAALTRLHPRWKTPHIAILAQGAVCSIALVLLQAGENLRAGYQLLVDMTVITYFLPFLYLFGASWKHGARLSAACGLTVTAAAIGLSLIPPADVASVALFEAKLIGGCVALALAARMCFKAARKHP